MKELLLFQAGNIQVGLDLPLVKSIHSVNARFAEQAGKSRKLFQVIDGEDFLLYDLPSIFRDETSSGDPMSQKVILVEAHEHPIALGVDRVERVVSVNSDHIQPLPPIFKGLPLKCFPRVVKHEKELILLFNPEGIQNLAPEIPDTKTYMSEPEAVKSPPDDITIPGPMTKIQTASDISEIPQDSIQKSKVVNGEPASDIPYPVSGSPDEIEKEQSSPDNYLPKDIDIDPDFEEGITSQFVEEARIAREEKLAQKKPFQSEESILSDKQEQDGSKLSVMDTSLEEITSDTLVSNVHDTEENTAVAEVDETAAETLKEPFQTEENIHSDSHEQDGSELSIIEAGFEQTTFDTIDSDVHDTEENAAVVEVDETEVKTSKEPFQPEESILSGNQEQNGSELSVIEAGFEQTTSDIEDNDVHDTEEKAAVADVDETASETSLEKEKAEMGMVGSHFETASVDLAIENYEDIPDETQYVEGKDEHDGENQFFPSADISLDSKDESGLSFEGEEPIAGDALSQMAVVQPEGIIYLKEAKAALENPEPESTDHLRFAEEDTNAPILPVSEVSSLLAAESTESELISKEPFHVISSDSSNTATPAPENQPEKASTPIVLLQDLEMDHGKRKASHRRPIAVGVLVLVTLLLLSIWLWPQRSPQVPEVVIKPIPIVYAAGEFRKNENQGLSQTQKPLNTSKKSTGSAQASLKAGPEVFKIETNDFTLTVERPKTTDKNGRQPVRYGMTGENELSHIVVKDDTLWQIAKRYLDDPFRYPELAETSRISDPDQIYPGDVVRIIKKKKQREGKQGKSSQERSMNGNR